MSNPKRSMEEEPDAFDPFSDKEFEVDGFIDSMGSSPGGRMPGHKRSAWQRLEEHRDRRRLRAELEDWEDWEPPDAR